MAEDQREARAEGVPDRGDGFGRVIFDKWGWTLMALDRRVLYEVHDDFIDVKIEGFDYERADEFAVLKRFLNVLAADNACYADGLNVDPDDVFEGVIAYHEPPPRTRWHGTIEDDLQSFHLGRFDATKLKTDINEWRCVAIFFCDPQVSWEEYLNMHPRSAAREMMKRDTIKACYVTGGNEDDFIMVKHSYREKLEAFFEDMKGFGFTVRASKHPRWP